MLQAQRQVKELGKWGCASFCWSLFNWFFSSTEGPNCSGGFGQFPSFGLQALKWHWNFDFGLIYIGVGMICPHIVNASMMAGAVFSWGIMWPLISSKVRSRAPPSLGKLPPLLSSLPLVRTSLLGNFGHRMMAPTPRGLLTSPSPCLSITHVIICLSMASFSPGLRAADCALGPSVMHCVFEPVGSGRKFQILGSMLPPWPL